MKHPDPRCEKKISSGNYNQKWASSRMVVSAKDMHYYWFTGEGNKKLYQSTFNCIILKDDRKWEYPLDSPKLTMRRCPKVIQTFLRSRPNNISQVKDCTCHQKRRKARRHSLLTLQCDQQLEQLPWLLPRESGRMARGMERMDSAGRALGYSLGSTLGNVSSSFKSEVLSLRLLGGAQGIILVIHLGC